MNKLFTLLSFIILHCTFFIGEVMAQTPPPGGANAGAPFDGFTTLLLAGGIGYGVSRIQKHQKEK